MGVARGRIGLLQLPLCSARFGVCVCVFLVCVCVCVCGNARV